MVFTGTVNQALGAHVVGSGFETEALNPWFSVASDEGRPIMGTFSSVKISIGSTKCHVFVISLKKLTKIVCSNMFLFVNKILIIKLYL